MEWFVNLACLLIAMGAIVQAVLSTVQTFEHRRFAQSRFRKLDRYRPVGRVMLSVPCRGGDVGLEKNLHAFFEQDYDDYQIRFVVESRDDPVDAILRRVVSEHPEIDAEVLVAGRAEQSGQKVHNLLKATSELPEGVIYLAFVDSDARPGRHWLRALIARLDRKDVGATTGYRWFVPERRSLANDLLSSINGGIATFFGRGRIASNYVWGGSWAIRRDRFQQLGIGDAWQGTLSDDLVASRVIHRSGFRIEFEPACMVASPLDGSLYENVSFVRRQYLIARFHVPMAWLAALVLIGFSNVAFWGSLVAWVLGVPSDLPRILPASLCLFLYLTSVYRASVRQKLPDLYFPKYFDKSFPKRHNLTHARWFDILFSPLASLVNGCLLLASTIGRHITWRGITYRLDFGGQMRLIHRRDWERDLG